jgi:hypothetical protein
MFNAQTNSEAILSPTHECAKVHNHLNLCLGKFRLDKGKPFEKMGRKATDPSGIASGTAGLPGENSTYY